MLCCRPVAPSSTAALPGTVLAATCSWAWLTLSLCLTLGMVSLCHILQLCPSLHSVWLQGAECETGLCCCPSGLAAPRAGRGLELGPEAVPHCPRGRVPAAGTGRSTAGGSVGARWSCSGQGLAREKNLVAVHNAPSVSLSSWVSELSRPV